MDQKKSERGFTLIELLTVMAIISTMSCLLLPALPGFQSTYHRKQAIDILMETLEQARLAALQSGQKVEVIFAKASDSGQSEDAMIVRGEPALGALSSAPVLYTRWVKLPSGICFRSAPATLGTSDVPDPSILQNLPPLTGTPAYSCVIFNSAGQVEYPVDRPLKLALFEGNRQGGVEQAAGATASATHNLAASGLYDVISLTKFTGRSRNDSATLE